MENNKLTECPNCKHAIKTGFIGTNNFLDQEDINIINEYHETKNDVYCDKCGKELYTIYKNRLLNERKELSEKITSLITFIPVVSIHSPLNWDYEVIGLVTGQSTTGTGVFAEFYSSFTDFFGTQSKSYNKKIKGGENLCKFQIRKQTIDLGGNAIVATDIDYSEVGGEKGMLLVCMTGTAIKLKNLEILGQNEFNKINELFILNNRITFLNQFELSIYDV